MQPPQSIEGIKAGLETTEKGGVRQSIRNCLTVFQRDPLLSGAIAYNILTDRKDIIKPIGFHRESTALNDTDMKYLLLYLEETYGLTNEKKIDNAIGIVANENKYHPIRDYLSALVWDGTERIRFCLRHFLGADADDYTYEALKLFLLGAISRAFQPGCKFEIMLCLVGGQGAGKSTFFRLLAVRDEWFSDDLRKLDDDNVYRKLQGHWIIEMSEMMATANAKSIEEIKSFLSRQKEVYKIPYETHPADRPRQCVFGGTSNALDFLPLDRSGNRRFIPVMVYPEQAEVHILEDEAASRAYIEQMWAEAMEIYRSGRFKLAFSPTMQRYLKEHQRDFMPEDTKAGMLYGADLSMDIRTDRVVSARYFSSGEDDPENREEEYFEDYRTVENQPVSPEQWEQLEDAVRAIEPLLVEVKPGQDSPADRMPEIGVTDGPDIQTFYLTFLGDDGEEYRKQYRIPNDRRFGTVLQIMEEIVHPTGAEIVYYEAPVIDGIFFGQQGLWGTKRNRFSYQFNRDVHEENRWIYHAYYMGKTGEEHVGLTLTKEYWEPVGEMLQSVDFSTFPAGSSFKSKRYATLYYSDGKQMTVQPDAQTMNQLREYFEELNGRLLEQADGE